MFSINHGYLVVLQCNSRNFDSTLKNVSMKLKKRHIVLLVLLIAVIFAQLISSWGRWYASDFYPVLSWLFTGVSAIVPFSIGDVFVIFSILVIILLPIYSRCKYHMRWRNILLHDVEYLLWVYVWFYIAWGLNYSQPHFMQRAHIQPARYTSALFARFMDRYITDLNNSYIASLSVDREAINCEVPRIYQEISDSLKIHTPQHNYLKPKTMLFSDFISSVGVSGYMGPFFCEFHLNRNLLSVDYPAVYAHEMAHLLGISSEAEANFYAYQVCLRSDNPSVRFSGYFFIMGYVLNNAQMLMTAEQFNRVKRLIRPEIKRLYIYHRYYWQALYSPTLGAVQNWLYELYLRGNKIENGQKNYSQVVGLLISYERYKKLI